MIMHGPSGEIRVGYQVAAQFGAWEITPKFPAPDVLAFEAPVTMIDDYWIDQEPLELRVRIGRTQWIWDGDHLTLTRDSQTLYADLKGKPRIEPV